MRSTLKWLPAFYLATSLVLIGHARAQTQIKARVLLMVDTSGSMVSHLTDNTTTAGDGSAGFKDATISVPTDYRGLQTGAVTCDATGNNCNLTGICPAAGPFDGANSRLFAAKQAITNVLNGSGDIDWGLMRYQGTTCTPVAAPFTKTACVRANQCVSNVCTANVCACASDLNCNFNEICIGGQCGVDANFACNQGNNPANNNYLELINNAGTCLLRPLGITFAGSCGTGAAAGNAGCASQQGCYQDTDCTGAAAGSGRCAVVAGGTARSCSCASNAQCPGGYTCDTVTTHRCLYNNACQSNGGAILVDPSTAGSNNLIFPYVDNFEDYTPGVGGGGVVNPELRADGLTPLAGAARSAAVWYNNIKNGALDAQIACRPYVLVQLTDGFDSCDADVNAGPVAAAQDFVVATAPGARVLNKVYVIGLAFGGVSSASLDAIAAAGGTNKARLANSATDIEAALADIVSSSVLVEKCNNADDDCDGACDEPFPDVAVSNAACSNLRAAKSCTNGQNPGTHCFAQGSFVCSVDQLSEVCSAQTCATNPALCPTVETCNGADDDCNGVIDDCTPFVPNSCCTNQCPACNPTGVPQPETCNGCDDDCDGVADNHLTDTGIACGLNVGDCVGGTTFCCQQVNPTTGTCSTDGVTQSPVHTNNDKLFCLGGVGPAAEICDGTDHDCNGVIDDISQSCFQFPSGTPGVGICRSGIQQCTAVACATAPNACCPPGWPVGKACPGPAMFGVCSGAIGPQPEVCNGIDDNCNGTIDDNVIDIWAGTACCPTGNNADCTNTGTGSRCKLGTFQCVGGSKQCVGGIAKSAEVCNGVDDDCNGPIDDNIPGNGQPCSGGAIKTGGICKAKYQCLLPVGTGPNGLTCVQTTGPATEICNGLDDDCNGVIDDPAEVSANDPRVGVVGGSPCIPLPAGQMQPPCNPGTTACVNGAVVCQGEVQPMANQCNGISTDCTGMANMNGNCPSGFQCYQGNCSSLCTGGEFPCPGGFVSFMQNGICICIPDACVQKNCPPGQICNIDNTGAAQCIDPCASVSCPSGFICKAGVCVDNTCKTQGCPNGQICTGTPPTCEPDPCLGVTCPAGEFCVNGNCASPCNPPCPTGKLCQNGTCVNDPCNNVLCNSGQVCRAINGVGTCVDAMCGQTCNTGMTCCGGACMDDPCLGFACPTSDTSCRLDSACNPSCQSNGPKDQIVGAGGGGFACSVSLGSSSRGGGTAVWLVALLIAAVGLRRRMRMHLRWILMAGVAAFASGCKSNPYCLNCGNADLAPPPDLTPGSPPDLTTPDMTVVDLMPPNPDGICIPTNNGVEICDKIDNDCNGVIDDVKQDKLVGDPNNCGACGMVCDFTAQHQFGACIGGFDGGTPMCVPTTCVPGYVQLPGHASCDYKCQPTVPPTEVCDGLDNDCNGFVDDPFTKPAPGGYADGNAGQQPLYNLSTNNCGLCANVCSKPGAVMACTPDPTTGKGTCTVDHCINNGTDTFRHNPASGNINNTGCEYHCAVASTTVTSGSNDCDNTACTFPPEVCDGIDNNCNFLIDDAPTDVGGACGANCPGGLVGNCIGACKAGLLVCTAGVRICNGSTGPTPEICDAIDNDCNGTIDDGFGYPNYNSDPKNCGKCGTLCALPHAINKCVTDVAIDASGKGVCEVQTCNPGFNYALLSPKAGDPAGTCTGGAPGPENGPTGIGCYYTCPVNPQTSESCNGKDDNCDGCVDNGLTAPPNFCSNLGVCAGQGITPQCTGASGYRCNYASLLSKVPPIPVDVDASGNLTPTEKECDGKDNNCNGIVDKDGFATLGNTCQVGAGACSNQGTIKCNPVNVLLSGCYNGLSPPVLLTASTCNARDESCNGKDDDCDGNIDERVPTGGTMCYTDNACNGAHLCKGWVDPMVKVGAVYVYEFEASRPDATATSAGANSARACSDGPPFTGATGVLPWSNVTEAQAQAACASVKNSVGNPMRLCTAVEWQTACEGPAAPAPPMWSMSQTRNNYLAKVCNDDNNNPASPAAWATGTTGTGSAVKLCYTDWSSIDAAPPNRLYDMSGNVMEWTSTTVTSGASTYFKVRGGAYSSTSGGSTCEFDFDIFPASFANADVGFRCCSDAAP